MKNKKTIHNILEAWGRGKREVPAKNDVFKNEILSKVPTNSVEVNFSRNNRLPWFSFAFMAMAVLVFLVNLNSGDLHTSYLNTVDTIGRSSTISSESKDAYTTSFPQFKSEPNNISNISDNREFLKIGYNATIQTRDVADTTNRVQVVIRGFGGRIDSVNNS